MKNAHERFGVLEYTKRMKDTTTRIRVRLDRFIGEIEHDQNGKAHLISVLGGDSDVGAIWAAVIEQNLFTVEAPGIDSITVSLGEGAQCFRGTINIAGRRPVRHLVAISTELAKTRPGADPQGRRTILCDNDPTFVLYRIAQRYGLPVVPEWATWFIQKLTRHRMIQAIVGLGCSPVLVRGSKKVFLKWMGRGLRQKRITFPESSGPVHWSFGTNFFRTGEIRPEDDSPQEACSEIPTLPATQEGESCVSY
ncbi:MAG: hypothetical protein ABSE93_02385 [Terriglobia bacterium]|jgi:hypothetical protein